MTEVSRRIEFARFLKGWSYEEGSRPELINNGQIVQPSEYGPEMEGFLFCPECFTNLNRVPKDKEYKTNGIEAYFAHTKKYKDIRCNLRSRQGIGKRYENWEEAKKAIENEELLVIHSFKQEKPQQGEPNPPNPYDETAIEDQNGPESQRPIGRHQGNTFTLPSKITTISGMCRNFDKNIYKYISLPGEKSARRLIDLLKNVNTVSDVTESPSFYYGRIKSTDHLGAKADRNIRMTFLEKESSVADFCLNTSHREQADHGIEEDSSGRILIVFSNIEWNGVGLCFEKLGWGEFSLLPRKYEYLLD